MKNLLIKYGIVSGGLAAILFLGPLAFYSPEESNGFAMKYGELVGYGVQVLSMLFVIAGVRLISKQTASNFGFLRALGAGLGITVVATVVFYMGNVLYYVILDPDFLTEFMEGYAPAMLEQAETAEEKARLQEEFKAWEPLIKNGWAYAGIMCMSVFGFGVVFSLLSAFFFKHK